MSIIAPIQGFPSSGGANIPVFINQDMNISDVLKYISSNISTIYVNGCTLTIDQNTTLPGNITGLAGPGTITINSDVTLTINQNISCTVSTISGTGTLQINSGYTFTFSGNNLIPSGLIANGILALSGNYTLGANITNGSGNLVINSGYTLTVSSSLTLGFTSVGGSGTLSISSGYTLIIGINTTFSGITVSGSGVLYVSESETLTQGGDIMLSISQVTLVGTWANAGYNITIPFGTSQIWDGGGSITTGTTAGTLTVYGTVYWFCGGMTTQTTNTVPTFPLNITGGGIFIATPIQPNYPSAGSATNTITLSNTAINANSNDGSATGSGGIPYFSLSSVKGSVSGNYGIGIYDSTAAKYIIFVLIYVGRASYTYNVSSNQYLVYNSADISGDTIYVTNANGSTGTITLTGTAYV